jgi:restriction endonuclease S subunit
MEEKVIKEITKKMKRHIYDERPDLSSDEAVSELLDGLTLLNDGKGVPPEYGLYEPLKEIALLSPKEKLRVIREFMREESNQIFGYLFLHYKIRKLIFEMALELVPDDNVDILNPFSVFGSMLDDFAFHYHNSHIVSEDEHCKFVNFQENLFKACGVNNVEVRNVDFLKSEDSRVYDLIISQPPIGTTDSSEENIIKANSFFEAKERVLKEQAFLIKSIDNLKNGGVLVALLPSSIMFSSTNKEIRKFLTENMNVLAVIESPKYIHKGINKNSVLLIMQKKGGKSVERDDILVTSFKYINVDSDKFDLEKEKLLDQWKKYLNKTSDVNNVVSTSSFQNNNITDYYLQKIEEPDYAVKKIDELCQINPIYKRIDREDLEGSFKEIQISSVDDKGRIIKPRIVGPERDRKSLFRKLNYRADKGDVLVPLIQVKKFVPVVVDESGLIISSNYAVLDSKVSAYYLYWALSQEYVKKQIQLMARGSVIDRITLADLREVKIPWLEEKDRLKKEKEIKNMLEVKSFEEFDLLNKAKINAIFEDTFGYSADELKNNDVDGVDVNKLSDGDDLEVDELLRKDLEDIVSYQSGEVEVLNLKDVIDYIGLGLNKYRVKKGPREVSLIQSRDLGVMQYKDDLVSIKIDEAKVKEVMKGDVLMKRKGGVGPAAVFKNEQLSTFDDSIVRLVADEEIVKPAYLAMYLNSNLADYLFGGYLVEKSTTYIKVSDLKKVEILVPNINRQEELVAEFEGGD